MDSIVSANPTPSPERSRADYALTYAARGWAVVPLWWVDDAGVCGCGNAHDGVGKHLSGNSRGKHPHTLFAPHGSLSASGDEATLRRWFKSEPRLNIGIATGEKSGIVVVDIDPRDGGDQTWDDCVERNGGRVPDTVVANSGGGGEHVVFRYDPDQVVKTPGKGIQIKGNGGYIVVEPSRHHSGGTYHWLAECDPLEGFDPTPVPAWLLSPKSADIVRPIKGGGHLTGFIDPQRIADLQSAMMHLDPDPYDAWLQTGMALHSTDAPEAFELWDKWSQRSAKYNRSALVLKWHSFNSGNGLNVESIFSWAMAAGWNGETTRVAVPVSAAKVAVVRAKTDTASAGDFGLHDLPGVLGDVVRLANDTAPQPQPDFAVSAALALGSVIAGRRYIAQPRGNFTSLYFINVGLSASGKEHGRTVIEAVLEAAQWHQLIGPSGYTSDSAVFGSLLHQPAHIAILDEIGALLGNAQSEGMHYARAAMTSLVEAWGICHRSMRPKANSTLGLSTEQADALLSRVVHNPAITLLGMTTPRTFYGSIGEAAIEGGFLSRLIVVQTDIGRQQLNDTAPLVVPDHIIEWVKASRYHASARGNLAATEMGAGIKPTQTIIPTDDTAGRTLRAYSNEARKSMDALEDEGMAELEGRSAEKAMRIAAILAVSVDPCAPHITDAVAEWAVRYVRHWTGRTISAVREYMHGSKFSQWQADVLRVIQRGGGKGRTERDLCKYLRTYDGLDLRQRRGVLDALVAKGSVALVESSGPSGRGRKRVAWVAIEQDEVNDADE